MKLLPVKPHQSAVSTTDGNVERIGMPLPVNPFFNFSYFVQEIQLSPDRNAFIRAKKVGVEHGRLSSEVFEGYAPFAVFEQAVKDAQRLYAEQTNWLLKQFVLIPMLSWTGSGEDAAQEPGSQRSARRS